MRVIKDRVKLQPEFPFRISEITLTREHDRKEEFHWHDYFEFTYIRSGAAAYFVNEKSYQVETGDFVIFNHIEPHGWEIRGEEMKVMVMMFTGNFISQRVGDFDYDYLEPFMKRGSNFQNKISREDEAGRLLAALMEEIYQEWTTQAVGCRLMVKANVLKLLTLLTRHYVDENKTVESLSEKKSGMKRLEGVLSYMYEAYAEKITLEDMARKCFMSSTYFSSYFKKVTGSTFSDYLAGIRIREVQRLLRTTQTGVVEAAMECGFHNISNFYRIYKKHTGRNPSEERDNN